MATHPYEGPSEAEAIQLAEEKRRMEEEEEKQRIVIAQKEKEEFEHQQQVEAEKEKVMYLTSKRLCTMDSNCPGFTLGNQPSICRECGFSDVYHTIVVADADADTDDELNGEDTEKVESS